ncbi:hypothetical protein BGAL_0056g00050 [Botrytis galanthina]|uniref:Uncharacterized protein n=1 Tax=Botrytis galanthina TaxID=278940 RepID=A0A4S8R5R3_9HELO|nr:hypothetical protein BGAL_0056g00050 [Botrytis galanthina]
MSFDSAVRVNSRVAVITDPSVVDTPGWKEAEIGSGNGYGNALSITTILSYISLDGEANGTIDLIFQEQSKGIDLVTGQSLRFGIGFELPGSDADLKWLPEERILNEA